MENIRIERNNKVVTGIVSKTFAKRADIFGTSEFYEWMDFLKYFPDATMKVAAAKRKTVDEENKREKINTKNLTYVNMRAYIKSLNLGKNAQTAALNEFENVKMRSKIQPNPYKYVREWFAARYKNYSSFLSKVESNEENNEEKADA